MKKTKSLSLDDSIVEAGLNKIKQLPIKISFSQYVEQLILKDVKKAVKN